MTARTPEFLDWQVHDAWLLFQTSPPELALYRAQRLVDAKFERGDYSDVLQAMDKPTRDALARSLVDGKG